MNPSSSPSSIRPPSITGSVSDIVRRSVSIFSRRGDDSPVDMPPQISSGFFRPSSKRKSHGRFSRSRDPFRTRGTVLLAVPPAESMPCLTPIDNDDVPSPNTEILSAISEKRTELVTTYQSTEALPPGGIVWHKTSQSPRTLTASPRQSCKDSMSRVGVWRDGLTHWDGRLATADPDVSMNWPLTERSNTPLRSDRSSRPNLSVVIPEARSKKPVQAVPATKTPASAPVPILSQYSTTPSAITAVRSNEESIPPPLPARISPLECSPPAHGRLPVPALVQPRKRSLSPPSEPSRASSESSHGASSDPNDDTSCYSRSSSRTSLDPLEVGDRGDKGMEWSFLRLPKQTTSVAFSIVSPLAAGVFDEPSVANLNKPLPPSPTPEEGLFNRSRLCISKSQDSRPITVIKAPATTGVVRSATAHVRRSYRSFYRLDVFDEQFRRTNPNTADTSGPPSPTLSEAVCDLQAKLGEIPPLVIPQTNARSGLVPVVASVEERNQRSREEDATNDHRKRARTDIRAVAEALTRVPTIPAKSRKRQWRRFSEQASTSRLPRSPEFPKSPLSPRRRSISCPRESPSEDCTERPSPFRRSHSTADHGLDNAPPTEKLDADTGAAWSPTLKVTLSTHLRTPSSDAPEVVCRLPRPRMPTCKSHTQSARLSVLVPTILVDDGLILATELDSPEQVVKSGLSDSSPRAAELVLLRIMSSLLSLRDLASTAVINKGMRRVYQQNELTLLMAVFKNECLPAWELREWSVPQDPELSASTDSSHAEYSPETYRSHIRRDATVVQEIKYLMLETCQTFLRPDTVEALATNTGERVRRLDEALYRIWCFCKIFGGNKGRNEDVTGQLDWLKGGVLAHQETCAATVNANMDFDMSSVLLNPPDYFGLCNAGGPASEQLYDMTEVWNCLAALMQNYLGKVSQARAHGVFSTTNVKAGDVEKEEMVLEEWIFYILSIGPSAVLKLAQLAGDVNAGFALARINGWMDWMPPAFNGSRSTFLKEPVARLYEECMISEPIPSRLSHKDQERKELTRKRVANLAQEIRLARCSSNYKRLPLIDMSQERPWSVLSQQTASRHSSVTSISSVAKDRKAIMSTPPLSSRPTPPSMHPAFAPRKVSPIKEGEVQTFSAIRQGSLHPASSKIQTERVAIAVQRIVSMGFTAGQAREALKTTELPNGLDVTRAVELLLTQQGCMIR